MTIDHLKVTATAAQLIAERKKADAKLALQSLILHCQGERYATLKALRISLHVDCDCRPETVLRVCLESRR